MSRFDYVKYDDKAVAQQADLKSHFIELDNYAKSLPEGRAKALALTKLEEAYMWFGKAIRDEQIERTNS